jgi:hypothetical protein
MFPLVDGDEVREFLSARGVRWDIDEGYLRVWVPHVCPHLVGNDCDFGPSEKPIACKDFYCEEVCRDT